MVVANKNSEEIQDETEKDKRYIKHIHRRD